MHIPIYRFSLFLNQYPSTATMPSINWTGSAPGANLLGITESLVPAGQPAPVCFVYIAIFCLTNLLPPSCCIPWSDIAAPHRKPAFIKPQSKVGESNVRNAFLLFDMYPASACYLKLTATWDHGICSETRLLPGSSRWTNTFTGLKSSVSVI